jgi:hypothetical protein
MLYDEHNDHMCTLRLRNETPDDEQPSDETTCILQQRVEGGWLERGRFEFLELALQKSKDASVLLYERGISRREQYRLIDTATGQPFSYFDVVDGVLYPGTAPIAPRA